MRTSEEEFGNKNHKKIRNVEHSYSGSVFKMYLVSFIIYIRRIYLTDVKLIHIYYNILLFNILFHFTSKSEY